MAVAVKLSSTPGRSEYWLPFRLYGVEVLKGSLRLWM